MSGRVVIVGGGTAGCTVAAHLAARADREVVVVEPGPESLFDEHRGFLDALATDRLLRFGEFELVRGGAPVEYVEACALGGGSAINGMILSGEVPQEFESLTRMATIDDAGPVGRALLSTGGRFSRLWWDDARWNPGRTVSELVGEGRVKWKRASVKSISSDQRGVRISTTSGRIEADEVVLCAGAVNSPALLLRSGYGEVNPLIGVGLQNHPTVTFTLELADDDEGHGPPGFDACVVRDYRTRFGGDALTVGYERASAGAHRMGMISVSLMNPESRGKVTMVDGDVRVAFEMLSTGSDRDAMVEAVRHLIGICRTPRFSRLARKVLIDADGTEVDHLETKPDRYLLDWIYAHLTPVSHATSSCASAVDIYGRLRGALRVRVADASILESVPPCTPAARVTMEARRVARSIEGNVS